MGEEGEERGEEMEMEGENGEVVAAMMSTDFSSGE